ncbi:hypothetical protein Dsin_006181 [Dipteronia sinensis]|uniref:RNase H type-1 domain-containing protein n=1 Tax=Dipteronia sinensis TaxID=43782 RepID=A0AAE0AZA7_9ROSI|nr:hypothetical protein Dsin_006181 [Dipteronia sinensis]
MVEGLSALLRKAVEMDFINGVVFSANEVHISHLQFADDTILFLQQRVEYLRNARRIMRVSLGSLRWKWNRGSNNSFFTKAVGGLFGSGSITGKILEESFRVVVGRGDKASFWNDVMVEDTALNEAFPRVYTLANNKTGCIIDFREREGREQSSSFSGLKGIWKGVCPPKIEIFVWHILKGRISIREVLSKFDHCSKASEVQILRMKEWIPPFVEALKFNVDGSARGSPRQTCIGRVLKDHRGKVLCIFSTYIGIHKAIVVEVQAIANACELCVSRPELDGKYIEIVSDSMTAVSWINSSGFGNINFAHLIYDIRNNLSLLGQASIACVLV